MRLNRRSASIVSFALIGLGGCFAACSSSDDGPVGPAADETGTGDDTAVAETSTPIDSAATDTSTGADSATDAIDALPDVEPETAPLSFSDKLSEMSLYSNFAAKTVAPINVEYQVTYQLWADGLLKKRWIALPPGKKIDNTDMDHWTFPVGTRLWKEFSKDGKRLETRLLWQESAGSWKMGTYIWASDESEATFTGLAQTDLRGTGWDSPSESMCRRCHEGEKPGNILGFSAIQLADAPGGVNLAGLQTAGLLLKPLVAGKAYGVPGTDTEKAALGYLHANCGHCHNPDNALTWPMTQQVLRLYVDERDVVNTTLYKSTVNQANSSYMVLPYRIHGGDSLGSAVYERQNKRGVGQMPPIATKQVNTAGIVPVKTWIDSLPKGPPVDGGVDGSVGDAASGG
ncbi:MAG: hypothetical protein ACXVEF_04265 [Polyangiales bacterium]